MTQTIYLCLPIANKYQMHLINSEEAMKSTFGVELISYQCISFAEVL
jgi:hypothetical protein